MSGAEEQVHGKFKVFTGELASDGTLGALGREVEAWVGSSRVAPKSIGVEYLEAASRLLLSIGYRDDEAPYAVKLETVRIGKVDKADAAALGHLEQSMAKAGAGLADIICHELYVTDEDELLMVFMTRKPA